MNPEPVRERSDASLRVVAIFALGLPLGLLAALLVGRHLALQAAGPGRTASLGAAGRFEHGPDARTGIEEDWAGVDRAARQRLQGYGWVDRRRGIVRLPIEQAMERLAAGAGGEARP